MLLSQFSQELKKPSFGISKKKKKRRTKEKEEVSQKMKKVLLEQLKMS